MDRTLFTNRWYALRPSRLVSKKPQQVDILGHNLVLWRDKDNKVVVQNDVCPHRGARLSMGKTKRMSNRKSCIECPYHGWTFDSDGVLANVPSQPEQNGLVGNTLLDTYHTTDSGGLAWFCLKHTDISNGPPIIGEMHDPAWTTVTGYAYFENDWMTSLENSIDITHVNFVHTDFGDTQNGIITDVDTTQLSADHIQMFSTINHKSENLLLKFTERPDVRVKHDILLPNTVSIQFWVQDVMNVITYVTYTPVSENETLMNWVFMRNPVVPLIGGIIDHFFIKGMERAIAEDMAIVKSLRPVESRVSVPPDKIQLMFRAAIERLRLDESSTYYK